MADPNKDFEIGIKASGGDAAAEEIKKPIDAQTEAAEKLREKQESDKAFYAKMAEDDEKARQAMVAQLKKEEEARLAVVEARKKETAAAKETQVATSGPGTPMFEYQERSVQSVTEAAVEAKAPIEDVTEALDEMIGGDADGLTGVVSVSGKSGTAIGALGGRLLALAGGTIGVAIGALTGAIAWLSRFQASIDKTSEDVDGLGVSNRELSDAIAELDATPVNELAAAVERHAEAMDLVVEKNDVYLDSISARKEELLLALEYENKYKTAIIDRQVAEGKLSAREAAVLKGDLAKEALDQSSAAELAAAEARLQQTQSAIQSALVELTAAQEALRTAGPAPTEARDAAAANRTEAVTKEREAARLIQELKDGTSKSPQEGGLSLRRAIALQAQIDALTAETKIIEERGQALAEQAAKEKAEYDASIKAKADQVEASRAIVEDLRKTQAVATAEFRAAEQRRRLDQTFGAATIDEGTAASVADADRKQREQQAAAEKKQQAAADKAKKAAEKAVLDAQREAIDREAKGSRSELDRRAQRMGAAGLDKALVSKAESIAQGLSDGVNLSEAEQGLAAFDALIARIPEASRAQAMQAVAPFIARLSSFERMLQDLERTVKEGR